LQVGVFADYFNTSQTSTSSFGVGGRLAVPVFWKLEGEMAYDFDRVFTEGFIDNGTGSVSAQLTNMRILHGEFGPKLDLGHGPFHPFIFAKGGFVNYNLGGAPATAGTFVSSVDNLRAQNVNAVFYPGGGVQGRIGPVGLRLDGRRNVLQPGYTQQSARSFRTISALLGKNCFATDATPHGRIQKYREAWIDRA
jgi:hypothetical protein